MLLVIKLNKILIILGWILLSVLSSCGENPSTKNKSKKDNCADINLVNNQGTINFYKNFMKCFSLDKSYPDLNRFLNHVDEKGFDEIHKSYNSFFWNQDDKHNLIRLLRVVDKSGALKGIVQLIQKFQVENVYEDLSFLKNSQELPKLISHFLKSQNDIKSNQILAQLYRILKIQTIDHNKDIGSAFSGVNISSGDKVKLIDLFFLNRDKLAYSLKPLFFHPELGWKWQSYLFETSKEKEFREFFSFHREYLDTMIGEFNQILDYKLSCSGTGNNFISKMNLKEEARYFIRDFTHSYQNAADILVELNNKSLYLKEWCADYRENKLFSRFLDKSKQVVSNPVSYYYSAGFLSSYNLFYQNDFGVLNFYQSETYDVLHRMVQNSFRKTEDISLWISFFKGEDSKYFSTFYEMLTNFIKSKNFTFYQSFWNGLTSTEKKMLIKVISNLTLESKKYSELLDFAHQFSQIFKLFINDSRTKDQKSIENFSSTLMTFNGYEALLSDVEQFINSGTFGLLIKIMLEIKPDTPVEEKEVDNKLNSLNLASIISAPVKCDDLLSVFSSLDTINSNTLEKYDCLRRKNYAFTNILNQNLSSSSMSLPASKLFENQFITSFLLLGKWVHDSSLLSYSDHKSNENNLIKYYLESDIKNIINHLFPLIDNLRTQGFKLLKGNSLNLRDWEYLSGTIQKSLLSNIKNRVSFPFHRNEYECSKITSAQGGKSCWSRDDIKKLIKNLFSIASRDTDTEPFLYRLLKMLNPDVGIELPIRKKSTSKKSLSLLNFSRFIYDASETETNDRIKIHRAEGNFYIELTMLEQLETVIREIGFNDNVYGNYFKNQIAKAKNYVKKVRSLRKWAKGLSATEGIYRKRGKLDKNADYYLKNVITTFDSLIEVGTLRSTYHGGFYDKEVRLLISLVVGSSLKKVQSYFPVNPNKKIYKKHKGAFITELTNYSFLSQVNHYIRKMKIGGRNALNDESFFIIDKEFGRKFDPDISFEILKDINQDDFIEDLFHIIDNSRNLSEADAQRLERVGFRFLYLVSNSKLKSFDFIFKMIRILVKNRAIQSIVKGNLSSLISLLDFLLETWGQIQAENPTLEIKIFKNLEYLLGKNESILIEPGNVKEINNLLFRLVNFYEYNSSFLETRNDKQLLVDPKFNLVLSQIAYNIFNNSDYLNLLINLNLAKANINDDGADYLFDQFIYSLIKEENIKEYFEHIIKTIEVYNLDAAGPGNE
ncbi:hypothetical protein N9N67_08260 [Bacteriovoracaceae bacterium]|nr:hypothetical protein [Bacteriovoracaceae bacterium]